MKCVPVHHGIPAVLHQDEPWLHRHSENGALGADSYHSKNNVSKLDDITPWVKSKGQLNFSVNCDYFLIHQFKRMFLVFKEPSHRDGSFEYSQHMFWLKNEEKSFSVTHTYLGACLEIPSKNSMPPKYNYFPLSVLLNSNRATLTLVESVKFSILRLHFLLKVSLISPKSREVARLCTISTVYNWIYTLALVASAVLFVWVHHF